MARGLELLENGAREGVEPPAAAAAEPPRDAGGGGAVPPVAGRRIVPSGVATRVIEMPKGVHHGDADEASNLDQTGSDLTPLALFRPSITDRFISLYEQLICEPEDAFIVIWPVY